MSRMMRGSVLAGAMLFAAAAGAREEVALAGLQTANGSIAVEYQRATAESATLAAFAKARAVPVQILLAAGTDAAQGRAVAEAYAAGLRSGFSSVSVAEPGAGLDPKAYVVELSLARQADAIEVSEKVVEIRRIGTACKSDANTVACGDGGGVPMPAGKRTRQVAGERVDVQLRAFTPAPRAPLFEDSYSIHYAEGECRDGLSAARAVAGQVAAHATSAEPVGVRFSSSTDRLHCNPG
jgi:hypothetical protein